MENVIRKPLSVTVGHYVSLTKPGIILGNLIAVVGGYCAGVESVFNGLLFLKVILGVSFVIASACVFNNYIDRFLDAKMRRTQNRVLVRKLISAKHALIFGSVLLLCGLYTLLSSTNLFATIFSLVGFVVYVLFYSFLKHHQSFATLIGSVAGAMPPIIGYTAATNRCDLGCFLLFAFFATWQMPHFYAIALYRLSDYKAAKIPVLPAKKGILATKYQMFVFILAFIISGISLTLAHVTGTFFLAMVSILGLVWLNLSIRGFRSENDQVWARQMFIFSLVVITTLSATMCLHIF